MVGIAQLSSRTVEGQSPIVVTFETTLQFEPEILLFVLQVK